MVYQFEMWYANDEYDVMEDFAEILGLLDEDECIIDIIQKKSDVEFIKGEGCFICVDYSSGDYILPIVVLCLDNYAEKVRAAMLEWDNECRKIHRQKLRKTVTNVFLSEGYTMLKEIEEKNHFSIHDEFLKYE